MRHVINLEGVRIVYRNFGGRIDQFNQSGRRKFSVVLDDDEADALLAEGWNVKIKENDAGERFNTLEVKVQYGAYPPCIYIVTSHNKTLLNEETVSSLDYAEIENVDITINGSEYDVLGKQGISAYVKNMYVTVIEDKFADKYRFDE